MKPKKKGVLTMKRENVLLLKELIQEKDARLAAIGNRLETLKVLCLQAESSDELALISQEVRNLGEEIKFLSDSRKAMMKEVNDFYRPAA